MAAAIAASLVLTSIIFIYSSSPSDSRDVASVRENLQATTETESGREILSPKIDTPKEVIQEKPIAEKPNTSSIDRVVIEPKEALSRRGDSTEESSQEIPNKKLLLKIRLSADSPSGLYVISVLDEFGRNLLPKKRAVSRAGYVTSLLDLTNLSGSARICVGLAGEIPECSAVMFNK